MVAIGAPWRRDGVATGLPRQPGRARGDATVCQPPLPWRCRPSWGLAGPTQRAGPNIRPQPSFPTPPFDREGGRGRGRRNVRRPGRRALNLMASGATCVQRLDGSRDSAIHTKYRISLRSSSMREPRYPLPRVV
ncbi:hypothetical protein LOK49_LG13G00018 [Camellia lanceoleosa]|uniref:Uncharacterized protein n=1 Tax=Camellia lanceoleosa TaxID=1840588 RepID=A0ACC0FIH7_9ERIC|nr:hypothetical protein LOK49_LG13G00018 [Camellia lanceoleosa]